MNALPNLVYRLTLTAALGTVLGTVTSVHASMIERPEVRAFAAEISIRHEIPEEEVRAILADARHVPEVIERATRPAERLTWQRYRPIFLTPERVEQGVEFWSRNEALLGEVADRYGVDPEIIVAILGVESRYGMHRGQHRVIDALATLAFDFPRRAGFFRSELEAYLLLAREEGFDPTEPTGSYAGAMGKPQFIASSYRAYAVDHSGNGRRDLFNDPGDALASVANYLAVHGWRRGEPLAARVTVTGAGWRELAAPLNRPVRVTHTAASLREAGVAVPPGIAPETRLALIALEGEEGVEHWITHRNFYAVTRYNHSALYAMAVHQLAGEIMEARRQ